MEGHTLVLIHAKKGRVKLEPYPYLVLTDVDSSVAFLKMDGSKKAGKMSLKQFLEHYEQQVKVGGTLRSAYVSYDKDYIGNFSEVPVHLSKPIYDESQKKLMFAVNFLKEAQLIASGQLDEITLFIDETVSNK